MTSSDAFSGPFLRYWLPYLVLGLVVGAIVDRRRRLPLMISTDLVQASLLLRAPP